MPGLENPGMLLPNTACSASSFLWSFAFFCGSGKARTCGRLRRTPRSANGAICRDDGMTLRGAPSYETVFRASLASNIRRCAGVILRTNCSNCSSGSGFWPEPSLRALMAVVLSPFLGRLLTARCKPSRGSGTGVRLSRSKWSWLLSLPLVLYRPRPNRRGDYLL